jgi:hypothetical protein
MKRLHLPRQRGNRHLVYLETTPARGDVLRLALTDRALSSLQQRGLSVAPPPQEMVGKLLAEAEVVLDDLCARPDTSPLRDKLLLLIEGFARAEAVVRTAPDGNHRVVTNKMPVWSLRPEYPVQLARGLRRRLGLTQGRQRCVPWIAATATHLLFRRGMHGKRAVAPNLEARVLIITGNPSFERAVHPVRSLLDESVQCTTYDESLNTTSPYPGVLSVVSWSEMLLAMARPRKSTFRHLTGVWRDSAWWGREWLEEAQTNLSGVCRYYSTAAELYADAFRILLDGIEVVVTPQSASLQLRALLDVTQEVGVPVVVIPHGLYTDHAGWVGIEPTCFAVTGQQFADVLRRRSFRGRVEPVGATFFEEDSSRRTDIVVALRPIEKTSIASREALGSLILSVVEVGKRRDSNLTIGLRPHPRQTIREVEALIGRLMPDEKDRFVVDHRLKGQVWVGPESSVVAQARVDGVPVVLTVEPGMPTHYGFEHLPGVFLARGAEELPTRLIQALEYRDSPEAIETWRRLMAVDTGRGAATRISDIVFDYLDT